MLWTVEVIVTPVVHKLKKLVFIQASTKYCDWRSSHSVLNAIFSPHQVFPMTSFFCVSQGGSMNTVSHAVSFSSIAWLILLQCLTTAGVLTWIWIKCPLDTLLYMCILRQRQYFLLLQLTSGGDREKGERYIRSSPIVFFTFHRQGAMFSHSPSVANCSRCFNVISLYLELSARRS